MTTPDPFGEGRAAAEELRRALDSIREDAREVVRREVEESGLTEAELGRLVRDMVRTELASGTGRRRRPASPVVVAGVLAGALAGAAGYHLLAGPPREGGVSPESASSSAERGSPRDATPQARAGGSGVGAPSAAGTPSGRASPSALAGRYDSLLARRSPELEPLLDDLESAAAAPVLDALARWRAGDALEAGPSRRLHDALVQAAVNRLAGADLVLDGLVTRSPCRGASCGAILSLWEARGAEWGLAYPPGAAERETGLPTVERLLVVRALESAGG